MGVTGQTTTSTSSAELPHIWLGIGESISGDTNVISAWQHAGLIDTSDGEREYIPHADLRSFLGLTTADAIPDDVDTLMRQHQGTVSNALC